MGKFLTQSARVDGSTGGSLQPFTYEALLGGSPLYLIPIMME